jgi:hypothetical protein
VKQTPGRSNGSIPGRSRGPDARSVEAFRAALPRGPDATREAFRAAPAARTLEAFRAAPAARTLWDGHTFWVSVGGDPPH